MAKGKKKGASSGGPHKNHGPKRHMHAWCGSMKKDFADAGLLTKYHDYESWQQSMAARGRKDITRAEFNKFVLLSREEQKEYFKSAKR